MRLDDDRQKLFNAACRQLIAWQKPEIFNSIGPFDPAPFEAFDAARVVCLDKAQERLSEYSDEEIGALLLRSWEVHPEILKQWRNFVDLEINGLRQRAPAWYAGGFGHPEHVADFEYWAKMERFSVEEVLCLSVGIEPDRFPKYELLGMLREKPEKLHPMIRFLLRRLDQLQRRFGTITDNYSILPKDFISWAEQVQFEVPDELTRLVMAYHSGSSASKAEPAPAKRPDRREIDKVAQILTALAIDGYGYDPKQSRSPIPNELAGIMAELGLQASDETIRKYLRLGASFLPKDWKPTIG